MNELQRILQTIRRSADRSRKRTLEFNQDILNSLTGHPMPEQKLFKVEVEREVIRSTTFYVRAATKELADADAREVAALVPEQGWDEDEVMDAVASTAISEAMRESGFPIWSGGESGDWE